MSDGSLREQLLEYFDQVIAAPDEESQKPAYVKRHVPTDLFIELKIQYDVDPPYEREPGDRSPDAAFRDPLNREELDEIVIPLRGPYPRTTGALLFIAAPSRYEWKSLVWPCVQTPAQTSSHGLSAIEVSRPDATIANSERRLEQGTQSTSLNGPSARVRHQDLPVGCTG